VSVPIRGFSSATRRSHGVGDVTWRVFRNTWHTWRTRALVSLGPAGGRQLCDCWQSLRQQSPSSMCCHILHSYHRVLPNPPRSTFCCQILHLRRLARVTEPSPTERRTKAQRHVAASCCKSVAIHNSKSTRVGDGLGPVAATSYFMGPVARMPYLDHMKLERRCCWSRLSQR